MKMITLAQYCVQGTGHDLAYHGALHQLKGDLIKEVVTYIPKSHALGELPPTWQQFFSQPKSRFGVFPFRLFDYTRMYLLAKTPTVIFLETFNVQDFIAFFISTFLWASGQHTVCVLYRDGKEWSVWRKQLQQRISRWFQKRLGSRYIALTDSELVANSLGKKTTVVPIPHVPVNTTSFKAATPLILWFPGAPRVEKGIEQIRHLVKTQVDDEVLLFISEEANIRGSQFKITFLEKFIPREKYLEILDRAHVILLPYDDTLYRSRTSGPFVEAIVAGKWVVTTKGTWMAYELTRFGLEELIVDWANPCLLQEIRKTIGSALVQGKMDKMAKSYREFHSQSKFEDVLKEVVRNALHK
jgi:hypothetical protein